MIRSLVIFRVERIYLSKPAHKPDGSRQHPRSNLRILARPDASNTAARTHVNSELKLQTGRQPSSWGITITSVYSQM